LRHYRSVLLTGATGYIGIYLLRLLLRRTETLVHCLVRGRMTSGRRRTGWPRVYRWYFPDESLAGYQGRYRVHARRPSASRKFRSARGQLSPAVRGT